MVCKYCGTPLVPGNPFCPGCGTRQEPVTSTSLPPKKRSEKEKETEYVYAKQSPWIMTLAVFLLLIAAVGIWFSTTDTVRIVGKWKCERLDTKADEETYLFTKLEFDIFGNVTEDSEQGTVKGKYKLYDNVLSLAYSDPELTEANPYQFMGDSMLVKNDEFRHPLTRTDLIPFYLIILVLSIALEATGIVILIVRKKIPLSDLISEKSPVESPVKPPVAPPEPPVSYPPFAEEINYGIGYGTDTTTPTEPAKITETPKTTDIGETRTIIGLDKLTEKAEKAEKFPRTESYIPPAPSAWFEAAKDTSDMGGSRLKSTMRKADSFGTASSELPPAVPPTDSEHMERAGDL